MGYHRDIDTNSILPSLMSQFAHRLGSDQYKQAHHVYSIHCWLNSHKKAFQFLLLVNRDSLNLSSDCLQLLMETSLMTHRSKNADHWLISMASNSHEKHHVALRDEQED